MTCFLRISQLYSMKNFFLLLTVFAFAASCNAQQKFDLASFKVPKGWQQSTKEGTFTISKEDVAKGTYCLITLYKTLDAGSNATENFNHSWDSFVKENLGVTTGATMQPPAKEDGWELLSGHASFSKDGLSGAAILISGTGYNKLANILILTNSDVYEKEMTAFLESVNYSKPTQTSNTTPTQNTTTISTTNSSGFKFTTTNFDDGWTSNIKEDWVEVTKGAVKVILHYPKAGTIFPADPAPLTNAAWDILVAPRYSNIKNYKTAYITDYVRQYFGMAHLTENSSGKKVFVLLFKREGGWIECVTPDKNTFIQEFKFDPEAVNHNSDMQLYKPVGNMQTYNRFAIAASDISNTGKWSDHYSSNTFYSNYYTGASEGMSTYSSAQSFVFGKNQTYSWSLVAANSYAGTSRFAQAKGKGSFTMNNQWKITFSEMEGKPKTYDAYFSAVKNGRILWMNDANYPGNGVFTGFTPGK